MKKAIFKWLRRILVSLGVLLLVIGIVVATLWIYLHPHVVHTKAIVYGQRHGKNLAFDIVRPDKPNGCGVILMMSGGWHSPEPGSFDTWIAAPILRRGYTDFPVYHISQPEASVQEIADDVSRGVRFIRLHAREYGVDPNRLGVSGGSAGGHLSLLLATKGGPGPSDAADPVDRESCAVQAVAIFFPPTDLIDLGPSTENLHDDGPPKSFKRSFGPEGTNTAAWAKIGREISPIFHVRSNQPPVLIYHGDADTLVPLDQSVRFQAAAQKLGNEVKLVVHHGGSHGWLTMTLDETAFADWYDRYLQPENR